MEEPTMDEIPMGKVTKDELIEMIVENHTFHGLHEDLAHRLGQITVTDEAQHARNLYRAELMRADNQGKCRMKYRPHVFKASRIEDEFAEFRIPDETVVIK